MKHNWKKIMYSMTLIMCLLISLVPVRVFADPDIEDEAEEIVIPEDAIYISTVDDLLALADNCIDDDWSVGKTVVLQNDIDLTGVDFYGIPTFGGVFYGQEYTISGWNVEFERSVVGFFRYTQPGSLVDGLHLEGVIQPEGSSTIVGTIAGSNGGSIKNCVFTGTVSGKEIIGGIVGLNKAASTIESCTANGEVYGNHYIGGIAGENKGVIRQCVNQAEVNTKVEQNSLGMGLDASLDSLTDKESVDTATNIGGIAGTSTGVIRECENKANVGYHKMGHNIGGIVGSQNGYVVDCVNYAKIEGSDGVGGIVGQFKPNIVLEFGPDPIETMNNQINAMKNSIADLSSGFEEVEPGLSDGSLDMDTEMEEMKDSLESLEGSRDPETGEYDQDVLDSVLNDFSNSFDEIYQEGSELENITESMDVSSKMNNMMSQMEGMMNTMDSVSVNTEISIDDISRYDEEDDTIGKVAGCINYGEVAGESAVSGIAGNCDIEAMLSEDDVETIGDPSMNAEGSIRLVLRDCKNYGTVSATKEYVGGIAGQMVLGAIISCDNIGNMDALNANYVGGIAGNCDTYISACNSKVILAGADYVGGIAGCAVEVHDCYSFVDIAAGTEYVGSIIGGMEQLPGSEDANVSENYYYHVGTDRGGIDGINYKGATGRIGLEDYLAIENLDDMFKTVTVTFGVEGQEDVVKTIETGASLSLDELPVLSVEDGEMYDWVVVKPVTSETLAMNETEEVYFISEDRLTNILFSQRYEAEYEAKHMVCQSTEKTEDGHSIILAVGAFDKNTTIEISDMISQEDVINKTTVKENWKVTISNIGVEKLHYRIPTDMDAEKIQLFVKDATGTWVEREYIIEGSYIIFVFTDGEMGFALAETSANGWYIAIIAVAAVATTLLVISKRKKKAANKQ